MLYERDTERHYEIMNRMCKAVIDNMRDEIRDAVLLYVEQNDYYEVIVDNFLDVSTRITMQSIECVLTIDNDIERYNKICDYLDNEHVYSTVNCINNRLDTAVYKFNIEII